MEERLKDSSTWRSKRSEVTGNEVSCICVCLCRCTSFEFAGLCVECLGWYYWGGTPSYRVGRSSSSSSFPLLFLLLPLLLRLLYLLLDLFYTTLLHRQAALNSPSPPCHFISHGRSRRGGRGRTIRPLQSVPAEPLLLLQILLWALLLRGLCHHSFR